MTHAEGICVGGVIWPTTLTLGVIQCKVDPRPLTLTLTLALALTLGSFGAKWIVSDIFYLLRAMELCGGPCLAPIQQDRDYVSLVETYLGIQPDA